MDTKQYIKFVLLGNVLMLLFYMICPGLFREIGGIGVVVSLFILMLLIIGSGAAGMRFTDSDNRNIVTVVRTILFPFGMYTVLSSYGEHTATILAVALIVAVLAVLYFAEASPRREEGEMKSPADSIPAAVGVWTIINLGLAALMLAIAFDGLYELLQKMAEK